MWANNLRVFSAFAVVMLHVAVGFVGGIDLSDLSYGSRDWWAGNIYDSVTKSGLDDLVRASPTVFKLPWCDK